jgi:hypothetical protein
MSFGHHKLCDYVIWDLDNCLADDRPRIPLIDWAAAQAPGAAPDAAWEAYHAASARDSVGNVMAFNLHHGPRTWGRSDRPTPLFMTARPERFRGKTEEWIYTHLSWGLHLGREGAHEFILMMRDDKDHRRSVDVKRDMVSKFMEHHPYARIRAAYDDHPAVVEMYRTNFGLTAYELSIHDIETHTPPESQPDIDSLAALRPEKASDHAALRAEVAAIAPGTAAGNMARALKTFNSRNTTYGASYKDFGKMLAGMFPHGFSLPPQDADGWGRLALMVMLAGKLHRYAANYAEGGHRDSAHDAICYAAMLEELTGGAP